MVYTDWGFWWWHLFDVVRDIASWRLELLRRNRPRSHAPRRHCLEHANSLPPSWNMLSCSLRSADLVLSFPRLNTQYTCLSTLSVTLRNTSRNTKPVCFCWHYKNHKIRLRHRYRLSILYGLSSFYEIWNITDFTPHRVQTNVLN